MLIVPSLGDVAFVGLDTIFQGVFKQTSNYWERIATLKSSTTEEERHLWMALIPELREFIGERQFLNLAGRVQRLVNKKFERSISIDRAKFKDDQLGIFAPAIQELARVSKLWPDKLVVDALKAGASTTVYDGQYYFDTDHPVDMDDPASDTQSNLFTSRTLNDENLAYVRAQMMALKSESGVSMEITPNLLVVPPALERIARQILFGTTIALPVNSTGTTVGTSPGGAAGASNVMSGLMDLLVLPRLAGQDTTWYVMDTTRAVKPLIFQQREAPEFAFLNKPEDPNVFLRDEFLYGVYARGAGGYGPWFLAAKAVA